MLRRYIFDSVFLTYSLTLAVLWSLSLPEEAIENQIPTITAAVGVTLIAMIPVIFLLDKFKIQTLGEVIFLKPRATKFLKSFWGWHFLLTTLATFIVSLLLTEFSFFELTDPQGIAGAWRLYVGITHANLGLLPAALVQIVETIFVAFLATAISIPAAFILSFLSARNVMTHPAAFAVYALLRTFHNIARSVEPLIWALIFTVWVGIGPFAGMLALMIHSIASLAKQFSEIIEDANPGPIEAVRATGANEIQTVWFGIVPQVLLPFISFAIYRWDTNVRMATVIGLVGGGGIGTLLIKYQGQAMWPEVGTIIFVIAAAVWIMDLGSAYIREAIR